MIQKIINIKKLFQRNKPDSDIPVDTVHGTRCVLHVANIALFGVVMILTIASALTYYLVPITKISDLYKISDIQQAETGQETESSEAEPADIDSKNKQKIESDTFQVINEKNVFSHNRKEWIVKAVIPKSSELKNKKMVRAGLAKKALAKKKAIAGKPKKIILHGVVIAGGVKKALINNPLKGASKKKTLYVEEGDELEGYKVTSIEKDLIRLDWHGEEIVIMLYSGIKDLKQGGNTGMLKRSGITKLDYKYKVVEDTQAENSFNEGVKEVAHKSLLAENSLNLAYEESESFSMPTFEDKPFSSEPKMKHVADMSPDAKSSHAVYSDGEQYTVETGSSDLINLTVEGDSNKNGLSEGSSEVTLHGIVIVVAREIKKALVNIPLSDNRENRTLYVEEGDGICGYMVKSIESDLIRLDFQGKEMVVKFPPL